MENKNTNEEKKKCCKVCSEYFEHRLGSHSDDYGGGSDIPCYCNKDDCGKKDCSCHSSPQSSWEEEFEAKFNTKHGGVHHMSENSIRRKDCEICKQQRIDNPKGYYRTYLSGQKCYWNEEMFNDVKSFIQEKISQARAEAQAETVKEILSYTNARTSFGTADKRYREILKTYAKSKGIIIN